MGTHIIPRHILAGMTDEDLGDLLNDSRAVTLTQGTVDRVYDELANRAHAREEPVYRPDQLLAARHDTPDQTGAITDFEPL